MKKTADIMYKVARIIALVLIFLYAAIATVYLILMIAHIINEAEWERDLGNFVGLFLYSLFEIVVVIVTGIQFRRIAENPDDKTPHIVNIVFGVLGGNPFFIVGAILNIIMICQREDASEEKKEEVAAEPKEEKPAEEKEAE